MNQRQNAARLNLKGQLITWAALLGLAGVYVRALAFTPIERTQGLAQKIFYIHAPAAMTALMAFVLTGVVSRLDLFAASSAEVGVAFSVVMLTTGPIWGKPIWGTWWSWDARLTSTLFIFLLFVGYLVMRGALEDPAVRAQYSSVIGIMGLLLVPFIHLTVYLFRTLHPTPIIAKPSAPSLPHEMLVTLLISAVVFLLFYVGFVTQRYSLAMLRELKHEEAARGIS